MGNGRVPGVPPDGMSPRPALYTRAARDLLFLGRTGWPRSSPVHFTIAYFRNGGGVGVNILKVIPSGVTPRALTFR